MGLLGSLDEQDRALGLLNLGAGMIAGNRGTSKGAAFQNAVGAGMGNFTNTLALLGRQGLARDELSQRESYRKMQEDQMRQMMEQRQLAMQRQQAVQGILGRIGQPVDLAPTNANAQAPRIFTESDAIAELRRNNLLPEAKAFMESTPKQDIKAVGGDEVTQDYAGRVVARQPLTPTQAALPNWMNRDGTINLPIYQGEQGLRRAGASTQVQNNFPARADFKDEQALRKEYQDASATYSKLVEGYQKVKGALSADPTKSAPATLAGATQFMKMLDPDSVVRESELSMALNSTGMMDRFLNLHNYVTSGKVLTKKQVEEIGKIADVIFEAADQGQSRRYDSYRKMATDYGFNLDRSVPDLRPKMRPKGNKPSMLPRGVTVTPVED